MARSVSLSDEAFAILRGEKRPNESDSDVVIRLSRTARQKARDPHSFGRTADPDDGWTLEEYLAFKQKMLEGERHRWEALR